MLIRIAKRIFKNFIANTIICASVAFLLLLINAIIGIRVAVVYYACLSLATSFVATIGTTLYSWNKIKRAPARRVVKKAKAKTARVQTRPQVTARTQHSTAGIRKIS